MNGSILIVDDQPAVAGHLRIILEQAGHRVVGMARCVNFALELIADRKPSLVVLDICLKGSLSGIRLGQLLKEQGMAFVYMSAIFSRDTLELAKATEPYGFLVKPFRDKDLLVTIEIALYLHAQRKPVQPVLPKNRPLSRRAARNIGGEAIAGSRTIAAGGNPGSTGSQIIGESGQFQAILRDVEVVAPADTSVLLLGETGTGKEVVAGMIHRSSPRKNGPYIKVNCGAMPSTLIESLLFGHEQGAFTGATQRRHGKFEQADNGTILLDEIGELGLDMQVKLLRVLQEKEVERLGGEETVKVNCRIITATNKDLAAEVAAGRFRMDLYYRLNVFPITLPPLRERLEDIPALARYFVELCSCRMGKLPVTLAPSAIGDLQRHTWPGNIRELEHTIERLMIINREDPVRHIDLPGGNISARTEPARAMISTLEDIERQHIIDVLKQCKGKVAGSGGAAEFLQMPASTLNSRMKKLGIQKLRNVY